MSHTVGILLGNSSTTLSTLPQLSESPSIIPSSASSNKVWVYPPSTPLNTLLEPYSHGIHRILIPQVTVTGEIVHRVLSQTDVIRFLYNNCDQSKQLMSKTIRELNLGSNVVKTIPSDTRALDAFKKMSIEKVTALAIVDKENGKLVGNLSASDLRSLNAQKLPTILDYVGKFLIAQYGYVRMPITVSPESKLEEVMKLLLEEHIHRVWLVDDSRYPTGVVTMTDVIFVFDKISELL